MSVKIELKAVIESDASTFMNLKRFLEKAMKVADDTDRRDLGELLGVLNDYDLEAY